MYRLAICAAVSLCIGCGKSEPSAAEATANELSKLQAHAEVVVSEFEKQEAAEKQLKDDLSKDPSPVADAALVAAKKGYAEQYGDKAIETASISVDRDSIKTFGGEKWTVRGSYSGHNATGDTVSDAWEATLRIITGKLQVFSVKLHAP